MTTTRPAPAGTVEPTSRAPWHARLTRPLVALLTQGLSPARLASTLATGTVCALFPFLGTTTVLTLGVGLALRMNQPLLQTLNQLLGPLQLLMILVYARLGAFLWRAEPEAISLEGLRAAFTELGFGEFLARFGLMGWHAFTAWALTAPLLFTLAWLPARAIVRRLARDTRSEGGAR